jgi:hypothetical protein
MYRSPVLVVLALTAGMLAGCGSGSGSGSASGSSSAYCQDLKSDKTAFDSLGGSKPDVSKLQDAFDRMHKLADEAPPQVSADWKVLDNALTTMEQGLKDAGLSFKDLGKLQQGQTPSGVNLQKLQALAGKLQALGGAKVTQASKNIAADAKKTCHVTLS